MRITIGRWLALFAVLSVACAGSGDEAARPADPPAPAVAAATADTRSAAAAPAPPVVGDTPRAIARQLRLSERAIRSDATTRRSLAEAGHLQQRIYRELALRPRLERRVLHQVPRWLARIAGRNIGAQRQLNAMSTSPPPDSLPRWQIIAPAPRSELRRYYRSAQERFGVRWRYLAAINLVETRMGRIRGLSSAGAQGPMQFMPATWDIYGRGDILDPRDAIMAAGRYLDARGAPGDMDRALYSYNNDIRYVRAVKAYAEVMRRNPRAYRGYYGWQVYYRQSDGAVWLPVGWDGR